MADRITEQGPYDILYGQGAQTKHGLFYQIFLDFIFFLHPFYLACTSNHEKSLHVQRVIDFVHRHGKRFLQRQVDPVTYQVMYTELNETMRYNKCRAALCERRVTERRMLRPYTVVDLEVVAHPAPPDQRQRCPVAQEPWLKTDTTFADGMSIEGMVIDDDLFDEFDDIFDDVDIEFNAEDAMFVNGMNIEWTGRADDFGWIDELDDLFDVGGLDDWDNMFTTF